MANFIQKTTVEKQLVTEVKEVVKVAQLAAQVRLTPKGNRLHVQMLGPNGETYGYTPFDIPMDPSALEALFTAVGYDTTSAAGTSTPYRSAEMVIKF